MSTITKNLYILGIFLFLASVMAAEKSSAFDWQKGKAITVAAADVVNDDLYATGETVTIDGVVNGDVIAFAGKIIVNGTVKGDLFAAGQTVQVLGQVTGNVRTASAALEVGEKARIGGDIIGAGAGLELKKGAVVARDLVFGGAALALEGDVGRNVWIAAAGLEIKGNIGGNVTAKVAESKDGDNVRIFMGPSSVEIPSVKRGLTVDPNAKIKGTLHYTQSKDLSFPAGTVLGEITRTERALELPRADPAIKHALGFLRSLISSLLVGLLLLLLFPRILTSLSERIREKPFLSLLWGFVLTAVFVVSLLLVGTVIVLAAAFLGLISFGGLLPIVIIGGLLLLVSIVFAYLFVVLVLAKIVVGLMIGRWLLGSVKSPWAERKFVPLLVGLPILLVIIALVSLPFIPGIVAMLLKCAVALVGLGSIWLKCRAMMN